MSTIPVLARLTYKDGNPIFSIGNTFGNHLVFDFGSFFIYDNDHPVITFHYVLQKKNGGYEIGEPEYSKIRRIMDVTPSDEMAYFITQKPKIDALIDEANVALANNLEFDFSEWVIFWKNFDKDFVITTFERDDNSEMSQRIIRISMQPPD